MYKYTLPIIGGIFLLDPASAQSLDQSDLTPTLGVPYLYSYTVAHLDPAGDVTGPGQTWDFSTAQPERTDTVMHMLPAGTPDGAHFPAAAYATRHSAHPDPAKAAYYTYWSLDATGMRGHGQAGYFTSWEANDDPYETTLQLPLNEGAAWSGTNTGDTGPKPGFPDGGLIFGAQYAHEVDASGTLILPSGTFQDVLRVHLTHQEWIEYVNEFMSEVAVYPDDVYLFYQAGISVPLLVTGSVWNQQFSEYLTDPTTAVAEHRSEELRMDVFPSPANGLVSVVLDAQGLQGLTVLDQVGRTVRSVPAQGTGLATFRFDVSGLPAGNYQVQALFKDGRRSTRRFVVL